MHNFQKALTTFCKLLQPKVKENNWLVKAKDIKVVCSYVSEVNKSEKGRLYYNLGGGLIKGGKEVVDFDKY